MSDFDFEAPEKEVKEEIKFEQFVSNVLAVDSLKTFNPHDFHGALRILMFNVKADKDYAEGSTFSICKLPQGLIRLMGGLCKVKFNLSCKSAILGWSKFRTRRGGHVEINLSGFGKIKKLKGVGSLLEHLDLQTLPLDSLEGLPLVCTAEGAGKKGDSIEGYLIYIKQ
jgi:hypothetical protein